MIDSFTGDYAFLSNFYVKKIKWEGIVYPTSEHAFQAAKTHLGETRRRIAAASTPGEAKRIGRQVDPRSDWQEIKIGVMYSVLERKFRYGGILADKLVDTNHHMLIEGNTWGDTFWGVYRGEGQNWLGRLLMLRRAILRSN